MKKITFKINKTGEVFVDAEGFKGTACTEKTKKFLEGLGKKVKDEKKSEYYTQQEVQVQY